MSLSDYDDELKYTDNMTKAHNERTRNQVWCSSCERWHSKHYPHDCERKRAFYQCLKAFLNYNMKHGSITEELADEVLCEWDYEHQKEWLDTMQMKADAQIDAWREYCDWREENERI
jgi:protein-arginine kinase activator protein McsA